MTSEPVKCRPPVELLKSTPGQVIEALTLFRDSRLRLGSHTHPPVCASHTRSSLALEDLSFPPEFSATEHGFGYFR